MPLSAAGDAIAYWGGDGRPTFDLDMVDRAGRVSQRVLPAGQYTALDLSPDGARALVTERISPQQDALSMVDLRTGDRSRVTLAPGAAHFGVWAPDSRQVFFSSVENGVAHLYRTTVAGNDGDVAIVPSISHPNMFPTGWSPDSEWVLYTAPGVKGWDVFAVHLARLALASCRRGAAEPDPGPALPQWTLGRVCLGRIGPFEIYVQSFEDSTGKVLLSTHGGSQPAWRQDGRELFYVAADGTMMAAAVSSGDGSSMAVKPCSSPPAHRKSCRRSRRVTP